VTPLRSALYRGTIRHRRRGPGPAHAFGYDLSYLYLDLAEADRVFHGRWLWSSGRANVVSFRPRDHLDGTAGDAASLDRQVRDLVGGETGRRPTGPVGVLTFPRYWGYVFNPVSFWYCWDDAGARVEAIVAEVSNTPWLERHRYVLHARLDEASAPHHRYRFAKVFHVSPFLPMDLSYDWRFTDPGPALTVHMDVTKDGAVLFDATLTAERVEISGRSLAAALAAHPFMTAKATAGIYWQAFRLWTKRAPFFTHPSKLAAGGDR
jgi:DUF1365 family protein